MRVCSFVPAATSIILDLGLEHLLTGVTFECPANLPRVVQTRLGGAALSAEEIDRAVKAYKQSGESLYYIDTDLFQEAAPDLIFTQDLCGVCQIDTACVEAAIAALPNSPRLVPLAPATLEDVFESIRTIANELGEAARGEALAESLDQRLDELHERLRGAHAPARRVLLLEWMKPLYNCGHWIPEQIIFAGGFDGLSNRGGYSTEIDWQKVREYDPEVLVIAPCGVAIESALAESGVLTSLDGFDELTAARNGAIYFADPNLFTQPSARVVDGIELLAALFHPGVMSVPIRLLSAVRSLAARPESAG